MRRSLFVILVAAACGGKSPSTPTVPSSQLPPETAKTEEPKPAEPPKAEEAKPPEPPKPIDAAIPVPSYTVKLVSAGKGKKAQLKMTPKQGAKQQVELAMDFAQKQSLPPPEGEKSNVLPTVVVTGDAEVTAVDPAGKADYKVTIHTTDAQMNQSTLPADAFPKFKELLSTLQGVTLSGSLDANGKENDFKLHVEQPQVGTAEALQLLLFTRPSVPVLPTEPIGAGAKWTVTSDTKIAGMVDVTTTTDYQLVKHEGTTWTVKGTTKVTGKDQTLEDGPKLSKIDGTGTIEATFTDGAFYPAVKSSLTTTFHATETGKDPNKPNEPEKTVESTIELKQGSAITPKS